MSSLVKNVLLLFPNDSQYYRCFLKLNGGVRVELAARFTLLSVWCKQSGWPVAGATLHLIFCIHGAASSTPTVIQPQTKVLTDTDHAVKEPQEEPQSRRSEAGWSADLCCGVAPSWPRAETQPQVLCHVSSYIRGLLKLCFTYDINLIMSQVSREHQSLYRYTEVDNKISRSWKNI